MEAERFSKAQACQLLDISSRTLERYLRAGLITGSRHGGRLWISQDAIRDYWSRREQDGDRKRAIAERKTRKER